MENVEIVSVPSIAICTQAGLGEVVAARASCNGDNSTLHRHIAESAEKIASMVTRNANGVRMTITRFLAFVPRTKHRHAMHPPHRNSITHQISAYAQGVV